MACPNWKGDIFDTYHFGYFSTRTLNCSNEYALQTTKGQTSFDETTLIELRKLTKGKKLKL